MARGPDSTAPLEAHERAATARLMEAARDALRSEIRPEQAIDLLRMVTDSLERAALDLRRGHRAAEIDTLTSRLHAFVGDLLGQGGGGGGGGGGPICA